MLDRLKLIQKISLLAFDDGQKRTQSILYAKEVWKMLSCDTLFLKKHSFWNDSLNDIYKIADCSDKYIACSIDGSQIYPDRHSGHDYFLINIGGIIIRYGYGIENAVSFIQEPYVFSLFTDSLVSIDWVNAQRYGYELDELVRQGINLKSNSLTKEILLLLDGSLIFWHLDGFKDKNYYIALYNDFLLKAYDNNLCVVAYISKPKSKDLIGLANLFIEHNALPNSICNGINDVHVLQSFLPPGYRTTIFFSSSLISSMYEHGQSPCFFYCNMYSEIVRVELPLWVANKPERVATITSLIFDQVKKGNGYPLVIAEAHHHAVIKKNDRDFFYYALEQNSNNPFSIEKLSQKQQKKNNKFF